MNVRRRNTLQKWLKEYIVPIVWLLLIIILVFSVFFWGDDNTQTDSENKVWLELVLDASNTESYIEYPWNFKKKIEWDISLYKWEKVIVKEWSVSLSLKWLWDLKLNKLWELTYLENWNFSLFSSDLWINSEKVVNVDMRFAKVKIWKDSHISFSQNEMWSTIYLVNWSAEVTNLSWKSTVLANGQKITVSRLEASSEDVDLSLLKEPIDDYYKQSDWFIKNNWETYLKLTTDETEETSSGSVDEETSTWSTSSTGKQLIKLTNLSDESTVTSDKIDISGNYSDEEITKITVNWIDAVINTELKTFKFTAIPVTNNENDLIFKVYDDANDLLSKFIYTIFNDSAVEQAETPDSKFNVQTFNVDWSQFVFSMIKDGINIELNWKTTYTTYWDFLTIFWEVNAKWISSVSVNWFVLSSFDWSSWRYHPSILNNNLSVWTNVYEVKYFDANWKVVYTNQFVIIKKASTTDTTGG